MNQRPTGLSLSKATVGFLQYKSAERHCVQLIFVFLAMPWVLRAVAKSAYFPLTKRTAIILDNWMDYKHLSKPNFEGFNSLSGDNEFKLEKKSNRFPYDPSFFQNLSKR